MKLSAAERGRWGARIEQWFSKDQEAKRANTCLKQAKLANNFSLQATDQLLQASLDDCIGNYTDSNPIQLLLPMHMKRFFVDIDQLPSELQAVAKGRKQRSCLLNTRTGETSFELLSTSDKKCLFVHAEKGPSSRPSLVWCFCQAGVRGWYFWDQLHMKHNMHLAMLRSTKMASARHEQCLVASAGLGPWAGCGHFCKYAEALEEYCSNYDRRDLLFGQLYGMIIHDMCCGVKPMDFGCPAHMDSIFSQLPDPLLVETAGELSRPGRWWQATRRWRKVWRIASRLLLAILYLGIVSGWWRDIESSPLHRLDPAAADRDVAEEEAEEEDPEAAEEHGNDDGGDHQQGMQLL